MSGDQTQHVAPYPVGHGRGDGMTRRYELEPLLALMGCTLSAAQKTLGIGGPEYRKYRAEGMSRDVAERKALRAGFHPYEIVEWDMATHDLEAGSRVCAARGCEERFLVSERNPTRHKYCSPGCKSRESTRAAYERNGDAKRAAVRTYDAENRETKRRYNRSYYRRNRDALIAAERERYRRRRGAHPLQERRPDQDPSHLLPDRRDGTEAS